jgi:hypothetical protein
VSDHPIADTAMAAIGLGVLAAVVGAAVAASKPPKAITAAEPMLAIEPPPPVTTIIRHPKAMFLLHYQAALTWQWCGESVGYFTCFRPAGHLGKHCQFDLSSGHVDAVWPYPDRFGPLCHDIP